KQKLECVKVLLGNGANPNTPDDKGRTALMFAVSCRQVECAELLIQCKADVNAKDAEGETPLLYAIGKQSLKCSTLLVKHGANVNQAKSAIKGYTDSNIPSFLINKGADVNQSDKDGKTLLMYASECPNKVELVDLLLKNGADIHAVCSVEGSTALMYAADVVPNEKTLKLLIEKGANVNARDKRNNTALIWAAMGVNTTDNARILIENGAEVDAINNDHYTALLLAIKQDVFLQAVQEKKLEFNIKDWTITGTCTTRVFRDHVMEMLHKFSDVLFGDNEFMKLLLDNNANANACDDNGETALIKSIKYQNMKAFYTLLRSAPDVNLADNNGCTPLMHTMLYMPHVMNFHMFTMAVALLRKGANRFTESNEGLTAEKIAKTKNISLGLWDKIRKMVDEFISQNPYHAIEKTPKCDKLYRNKEIEVDTGNKGWAFSGGDAEHKNLHTCDVVPGTVPETSEDTTTSQGESKNDGCAACHDDESSEICNLTGKEKRILLSLEEVHSFGTPPGHSRFTIYLNNTNDDETKGKIKEALPSHKFEFEGTDDQPESVSFGVAGASIGTPYKGTLGGCIKINQDDGNSIPFALTAHHVVKEVDKGGPVGIFTEDPQSGSVIWKPIGTLEYAIGLSPTESDVFQETTYDLALIKLHDQIKECGKCDFKPIDKKVVKSIKLVHKRGCMTNETIGKVLDYRFSGKINCELEVGVRKDVTILNAIKIIGINQKPFAVKGDSGSFVYFKENDKCYVIGMFYFLGITKDKKQVALAFPLCSAFKELAEKFPEFKGCKGFMACSGVICNTSAH
ncbi:unnamed protein product, partial [Owenia fusiformis]